MLNFAGGKVELRRFYYYCYSFPPVPKIKNQGKRDKNLQYKITFSTESDSTRCDCTVFVEEQKSVRKKIL